MAEEETEEEIKEEEVKEVEEMEEPEESLEEEEEEAEEESESEEEFSPSDVYQAPLVICPDDDVAMDIVETELKEVEKGGLMGSDTEVHNHIRYECPECGKFYTQDVEGGAKPGCFIATAAYGTPMADEIDVLRSFRDSYLLHKDWGKELVSLYYTVSPPIANVIGKSKGLRRIFRALLKPIVDFFRERYGE